MAAHHSNSADASDLDRACAAAVQGRRAARALSQWCERFGLSEPEFQVLWCLRGGMSDGFDQTLLAKSLAYSAAQVSSTVERLRGRDWIMQRAVAGDRRRNVWRLSSAGSEVVAEMLNAAGELRFDIAAERREAAA